jgi:hypothetical protein
MKKKITKQEYDKKLLEIKKKCGFYGRGYVNGGRFRKLKNKLNNEFEIRGA